ADHGADDARGHAHQDGVVADAGPLITAGRRVEAVAVVVADRIARDVVARRQTLALAPRTGLVAPRGDIAARLIAALGLAHFAAFFPQVLLGALHVALGLAHVAPLLANVAAVVIPALRLGGRAAHQRQRHAGD